MAARSRFDSVRRALEQHSTRIALAIAALGGVLRLRGLQSWALNPDEGIYRFVSSTANWSEFARGLGESAHPPFFFLLLRFVATLSSDPVSLRLPAALFGTLAIVGVFLFARRAFSPITGLVAAALLAAAPGAVLQSQLVRPYSLQLALLAFGWWALLGYVERGERRELWIYTATFGTALLTHYGSALALAASIGWLALCAGVGALERERRRSLALAQVVLLGLLAVLYVAHFRDYRAAMSPLENIGWLEPFLPGTAGELWLSIVGLHRYLFGLGPDGLATVLTCVGLASSLRRGVASPGALALVALGIGGVLAVAGVYPLGGTRHATWWFVFLVPLAAEGVRQLLSGSGLQRAAGAAVLAVGIAVPGLADTLVGASRLRFGAQVEHLATPRQLLELPIAALRGQDARVLLDEQAFYFLQPFFADAVRLPSEDMPYRLYSWGDAELVVSRSWVLRAGRLRSDEPDHVFGLRRLALSNAGSVSGSLWLVSAGWAPLAAAQLADRAVPKPEAFIRSYGAVVRLEMASVR